ncbi:GntR family transcriptional regulator [Mesorhizobium sp. B4-1-4]|uniref:GntR family transcriptional regulator n=1 Tax=Mesorhizobium sp. B4-1-4 TaxID=2589888 RepID=UPI00112CC7C2|nr:GntR family transcriptional regulator [Mesorhizobium sp. B4-1-4]UCI31838.1 GntR family transcriptional regulator [Mesorhizobium sp. B4-1-4]
MELREPLGPVEKEETLTEKVYRRVRTALVSGQLVPGQKLVHRNLSVELEVSPTPVREALLRLVSEGALDLDARGVAWVPHLPLATYEEIIELRVDLEGRAAARAAQLATAQDVASLKAIHDRLAEARRRNDTSKALEENERFHFGVIEIARMPVLRRIVENLWTQVGPTIRLFIAAPRPISRGLHPHEELLRALARHDQEAARAAVERDLRDGAKVLAPLLSSVSETR